jgi:CBS domain-containing protein
MRVGSFMKPAGQVISVGPNDTISDALGVMLENKVGAVVVLAVGDFTVAGKSLSFRSIDYPILR